MTELEKNGSQGEFLIQGINSRDGSGTAVSFAGDVDGDGIDDVIIGAPYAEEGALFTSTVSPFSVGEAYVVFGAAEQNPDDINLLNPGATEVTILRGADTEDLAGLAVSGAGDVNGDGFADVIVGAPRANGVAGDRTLYDAGKAYVVYGREGGLDPVVELDSLDGTDGFILTMTTDFDGSLGLVAGINLGFSVGGAGDVNGDGFDDVIVGARGSDGTGANRAGRAFVVFGGEDVPGGTVDVTALDGTDGLTVVGTSPMDNLGTSVSGAGDVNGDGFGDVIIGAPGIETSSTTGAGGREGAAFVLFGSDQPFSAVIDPQTLDGFNGFGVYGSQTLGRLGEAVDGAGDVNGDGFDDIIVGEPFANGADFSGEAHVVFGVEQFQLNPTIFTDEIDGTNGFSVRGRDDFDGERVGEAVSGAGDLNGDGFDDVIVGASNAGAGFADVPGDGSVSVGRAYVVHGASGVRPVEINLASVSNEVDVIEGTREAFGFFGATVAGGGDFNGDGSDDVLIGAPGIDANGRVDSGETFVALGAGDGNGGPVSPPVDVIPLLIGRPGTIDLFEIEQPVTVVQNFGLEDVLILNEMLPDGNGDGLIDPGSDNILNLTSGDIVRFETDMISPEGLSFAGTVERFGGTEFLYVRAGASEAQRQAAVAEATLDLLAPEELEGQSGQIDFFVIQATETDIVDFGLEDVVVFDRALSDRNGDGIVGFGRDGILDVDAPDPDGRTVTINGSDESGQNVRLQLISAGEVQVEGTDLFIYMSEDASAEQVSDVEAIIDALSAEPSAASFSLDIDDEDPGAFVSEAIHAGVEGILEDAELG